MKPCRFGSDALGRSVVNEGPPRRCALGHGTDEIVRDLVHCAGCGDKVAPEPVDVAAVALGLLSRPAGAGDCSHFAELSGAERGRRGLSHGKRWGLCGSPRRVELRLAEVTCACQGCGPGCRGYSSE